MRDYKDETIEKLCSILNCLEDCGCMTEDDVTLYHELMVAYSAEKAAEETDFNAFGPYSHKGFASYIAYSILNDKGERELNYVHYADDPHSADHQLRDAAKMICFSDWSHEIVKDIVIQGYKIEYVGWQSDMLFEFRDQESGEIVWSESFPQWEH